MVFALISMLGTSNSTFTTSTWPLADAQMSAEKLVQTGDRCKPDERR